LHRQRGHDAKCHNAKLNRRRNTFRRSSQVSVLFYLNRRRRSRVGRRITRITGGLFLSETYYLATPTVYIKQAYIWMGSFLW